MRVLAFAVALVAACAADPVIAARDCTPGQTSPCACPGGAGSVQVCGTAGTLGACLCPDAAADVASASPDVVDVVTARDVVVASDVVDVVTARDVVVASDVVDVVTARDVVDVGNIVPPPPDAGSTTDVLQAVDAGCPAGQVVCDPLEPRCVDLQRGEVRPGGIIAFCGACDRGCQSPLRCIDGRCGS